MSRLNRRNQKMYTKLLALLLGITLIPTIVLSALSYRVSINNAQKQAEIYSAQLLQQIQQSDDALFDQMLSFVYDLMLNYNTYSDVLSQVPVSANVLQMFDQLQKKKLVNPRIRNLYIVDNDAGKVLASENTDPVGIYGFDEFTDPNLLILLKDPNRLAQIRNLLFLRVKSNGQNVLSYIVPFPVLGTPRGYISVDLDVDQFTHLEQLGNAKYGNLFVTNRSNSLLTPRSNPLFDEVTGGKSDSRYLLIRSDSSDSGLHYLYAIPKNMITKNNKLLFWGILLLCLISLLVEVVAVWLSSKNIYSPLRNLLAYIKQLAGDASAQDENEYHYLYNAVTRLNLEKKEYMNAVTSNRDLFKQKQLVQLLSGNAASSGDIPDKLRLQLPNERDIVLVLEIDELDEFKENNTRLEQELLVYAIENVTEEVLTAYGTGIAGHFEPYRIVALLNHDGGSDGRSEEIGRHIQTELSRYLKLSVSIGIAEAAQGDGSVRLAYEQAARAAACKVYFGKGAITHHRVAAGIGPDNRFDPLRFQWNEVKEQLKIVLRMNEPGKAEEYIGSLIEKVSFVGIREADLQLFFLQYISVLFDLCGEFSLQAVEVFGRDFRLDQAMAKIATREDAKERMLRLAQGLTLGLEEKKAHVHQELIEKILLQIKENIDKDITLESIAEKVYMHPAYLSRICKSITGIGLGEQIVKARIDRAQELLTETNESIVDISEKVGYTHPRAFYRIFKDYTGFTPGDYRKRERLKNVEISKVERI